MSHIRVTIEHIPTKGKIEKWGMIAEIPPGLIDRENVGHKLAVDTVHTIAAVIKKGS